MRSKFGFVITAGAITYLWEVQAELSDSVIVLYKCSRTLRMHCVAGFGTGKGGVGGSFVFYKTGYSDIDGKEFPIWGFYNKINSFGNTLLYFNGVHGRKGKLLL